MRSYSCSPSCELEKSNMSKKFVFALTALAVLAIPAVAMNGVESGLAVGEMVTPFNPTHISGPDKGTTNCPPCTYGDRPAIQVWLSPSESAENVEAFAKAISYAVKKNKKSEFKGFLINLTFCDDCVDKAHRTAKNLKYDNIGFATLASKDGAVKRYKVNTSKEVTNTVFIYKDKKVVAKFVNLKLDKDGLKKLNAAIAKATTL